jgi:hypothetical protein
MERPRPEPLPTGLLPKTDKNTIQFDSLNTRTIIPKSDGNMIFMKFTAHFQAVTFLFHGIQTSKL